MWVAGHRGLVGSAIVRRLEREPFGEMITATSAELDLRRQAPTHEFAAERRPEIVFLAAATAGGINANRLAQATFLYDNLMIAANVIEACRLADVEKLVVLGSSCIYPREAPQPMSEDALLTGPLEPTNEGYAVATAGAVSEAVKAAADGFEVALVDLKLPDGDGTALTGQLRRDRDSLD